MIYPNLQEQKNKVATHHSGLFSIIYYLWDQSAETSLVNFSMLHLCLSQSVSVHAFPLFLFYDVLWLVSADFCWLTLWCLRTQLMDHMWHLHRKFQISYFYPTQGRRQGITLQGLIWIFLRNLQYLTKKLISKSKHKIIFTILRNRK